MVFIEGGAIITWSIGIGWILYLSIMFLKSREYIPFTITVIWLIYIIVIIFTPYFNFLSWGIKILILFFFALAVCCSFVFYKTR
ncbi:hypothetical protein DT426_05610 [Bacillus cereus]|jgi:hypothetical protein|nr:hypothetical protein DT426_05610 [Bacillus cereus]PEM04140.1 hypothetical protein CN602_09795 [Bacillus cereus]PFX68483.1 hypothetical protein COL39_27750 [Bacillus cereus]PGK76503.1 hypothetical protein CN919_18120 [Bacillus thuringiensis]